MNKILKIIKKYQWVFIGLVSLFLIYIAFSFIKNTVVKNGFFDKYSVLTVSGDDTFSYNKILLNGKVVEKTKEDWTNVLPIPGTLQYVLMTSSYSKGHDIQCGNTTIPKKVEQFYDSENAWCVEHNGKYLVSITPTQYYYYDADNIVYEQCLQSGYYESFDEGKGFNGCAERGLFLNEKQIATTKEKVGINDLTKKTRLEDSLSFNFHPSKKLGDSIIYSTSESTYAYNILSGKTTNFSTKLEDIFLTNQGETIFVQTASSLINKTFLSLGKVTFNGKVYTNVYSAKYVDGRFYILRITDFAEEKAGAITENVITYELLKDGKKIENLEVAGITPYSYSVDAIQQFPLCDTSTIVCIYEGGHYAYKNRRLVPEVFGYDFYTEEMVIDGEWRGDNIPNFIGRSKPIFEDGKLKYMVYANDFIGKGLYLIDFDKKWSFKDIYFRNGPVTTKLLSGYQNELLNVIINE